MGVKVESATITANSGTKAVTFRGQINEAAAAYGISDQEVPACARSYPVTGRRALQGFGDRLSLGLHAVRALRKEGRQKEAS